MPVNWRLAAPEIEYIVDHGLAKFMMVDTPAFYVGSQNLYTSDLAEYGYIVDGADAAGLVAGA